MITNKTPTYDCTATEDKFTVSSTTGNGKLTYPIALMTADEVALQEEYIKTLPLRGIITIVLRVVLQARNGGG